MIALPETQSYIACLECSHCKKEYLLDELNTYATCCNKPLIAKYEFSSYFHKGELMFREQSLWRYFEVLPVLKRENIVTLGEGMTPLVNLSKLGDRYGFTDLLMKDESCNPTGSFKARGLSLAVSKAKELGIENCIIPTAGNAGGAMAAYCAKAGMKCTVVMPRLTPEIFKQECEMYGANLILEDGLINDCAKKVAKLKTEGNYFDMSTFKEPYRLEGKKTMGYEIAEQLNWQMPDIIVYPTGGGTGLVGIWKAFHEMLELGWIKGSLPKMVAVQSLNCAPVIRAFYDPEHWMDGFHPRPSIANGLAVPYPFAMDMIQETLEVSNGLALTISEEEITAGVKEVAREEGILISPEGAAAFKAILQLQKQKLVQNTDRIVLLNTGSGYKYLENLRT